MKTITFILALLLLAGVAFAGSSPSVKLSINQSTEPDTLAESERVSLCYVGVYREGVKYWLYNGSDSVRYVKLNRIVDPYGETTVSIFKIAPNETESISFYYDLYNLHIKTEDGWVGLISVRR